MALATIGDLVTVKAPAVGAPKRYAVRLTNEQSRERAVLCAKMISEGRRNSDIKRACKMQFGNILSDKIVTEMRRGRYRGVGARAFLDYRLAAKKNADAVQPKGDCSDVQKLRTAFANCLRIMRDQDITSAKLDAVANQAEIEVRATKRMSL